MKNLIFDSSVVDRLSIVASEVFGPSAINVSLLKKSSESATCSICAFPVHAKSDIAGAFVFLGSSYLALDIDTFLCLFRQKIVNELYLSMVRHLRLMEID